jgi:hypothetical protein
MTDEIVGLLREIRDQQRTQLQGQAEALAVQRQQFELYTLQLGRVERLNDRAEAIQRRAGKAAKIVLWLVLPVMLLLLLTLLWPWIRYLRYWVS